MTSMTAIPAHEIKLLFSATKVEARVKMLADQIAQEYNGQQVTLVGVLNGAFMLVADLSRALEARGVAVKIAFITATSYEGTESGDLTIAFDKKVDLRGEKVLVVDDILDTGKTLDHLKHELQKHNPASLEVVVLLHKACKTTFRVAADYIGFVIGDLFVVGFGLDYCGLYRGKDALYVIVFY